MKVNVKDNSQPAQPIHVHKATAKLLARDPQHFSKLAKKRKHIPGGGYRDPEVARAAANKRWAGHKKMRGDENEKATNQYDSL